MSSSRPLLATAVPRGGTPAKPAASAKHDQSGAGAAEERAPVPALRHAGGDSHGVLESELFGHERGAFTGAIATRIGRFELADHGTLFLDEVGDIPLELQPKLLRVLQEQEFERLGSSRTIHTNVRLIAATHRNIAQMVEEEKFRSDLFYRLHVFPITVP